MLSMALRKINVGFETKYVYIHISSVESTSSVFRLFISDELN